LTLLDREGTDSLIGGKEGILLDQFDEDSIEGDLMENEDSVGAGNAVVVYLVGLDLDKLMPFFVE
jgi:hypothetical protein